MIMCYPRRGLPAILASHEWRQPLTVLITGPFYQQEVLHPLQSGSCWWSPCFLVDEGHVYRMHMWNLYHEGVCTAGDFQWPVELRGMEKYCPLFPKPVHFNQRSWVLVKWEPFRTRVIVSNTKGPLQMRAGGLNQPLSSTEHMPSGCVDFPIVCCVL